jgi:hypothetical protein
MRHARIARSLPSMWMLAAGLILGALAAGTVQAQSKAAPAMVTPVAAPAAVQGGGSRDIVWPRWQARIGWSAAHAGTDSEAWRLSSAGMPALDGGLVLGDYYFARLGGEGSRGGLRATGGLLVGATLAARTSALVDGTVLRAGQGLNVTFLRNQRWAFLPGEVSANPGGGSTTPYLGLGWSSATERGPWAGWGLSADLGVTASRKGLVTTDGGRSLDELLRDIRLAPVLNFGLTYSF